MTMPAFKYPVKNTQIKLFTESSSRNDLGSTILTKVYKHPVNTVIHSYVRQLSSSEQSSANAQQDGSTLVFVVSRRAITSDMFIEVVSAKLIGNIYQIDGVDNLEFYDTEIKLFVHKVSANVYTTTQYEGWLK